MENTIFKKIIVIANKSWEADPMVNAILHEKVRLKIFSEFKIVNHPFLIDKKDKKITDPNPLPRITFKYIIPAVESKVKEEAKPKIECTIELWCLQDIMNPNVSSSSTVEKWRVLPRIFETASPIDLVIAFGTAGIVDLGSCNASVVIGSKVFIHNPYYSEEDEPPTDLWTNPNLDKTIASKQIDFSLIPDVIRNKAETKFLRTPLQPADPPVILAGHGFHSLGIVNVQNYEHYIWADKRAIDAFRKAGNKGVIGSVESTHGLIRLQLQKNDIPFLFVSGITDEDGKFDAQVTPRVYSQNFVAAHNAGITLCYLLEEVVRQI